MRTTLLPCCFIALLALLPMRSTTDATPIPEKQAACMTAKYQPNVHLHLRGGEAKGNNKYSRAGRVQVAPKPRKILNDGTR
jgi:hypothetical protein